MRPLYRKHQNFGFVLVFILVFLVFISLLSRHAFYLIGYRSHKNVLVYQSAQATQLADFGFEWAKHHIDFYRHCFNDKEAPSAERVDPRFQSYKLSFLCENKDDKINLEVKVYIDSKQSGHMIAPFIQKKIKATFSLMKDSIEMTEKKWQ